MKKKKGSIAGAAKKAEPVVVDVNRLRISFSGVDTYLRCGKQYEFRYIDNIKSIPGIALLEGSAHHKAMEHNNLSKRDKGRDMAHGELTEIFMEDFRRRVKAEESVEWSDENEDRIFSRAKILHERYAKDIAPGLHPLEVERKFELPVDVPNGKGESTKILLVGVCDVEEEKPIWDYKTAAKSKGQGEVDSSLQLSLYALASKKNHVGIIEFLKKANPEINVMQSYRTAMQKKWALEVVASVARAVIAKVFPLAAPNTWGCSERFCGFWGRCRGKYT